MKTLLILATFLALHALVLSQDLCGLKKADDSKTCISIKLPWAEDAIFFCTEKKNLNYTNQCENRYGYLMGCNYMNNPKAKSLQVSTPWTCCPYTSNPDPCSETKCPDAPFNRTCVEEPKSGSDPWRCCPSHFCEENGSITRAQCHTRTLLPGCASAPKEKTNCIGFYDAHGCCNKYQCEGEGKPGMCPAEKKALRLKKIMEDPKNGNKSITELTMKDEEIGSNSTSNTMSMSKSMFLESDLLQTTMACVGDYNCPKNMKCCSANMKHYHGVSKYMTRKFGYYFQNDDEYEPVVHGYCMEAVY